MAILANSQMVSVNAAAPCPASKHLPGNPKAMAGNAFGSFYQEFSRSIAPELLSEDGESPQTNELITEELSLKFSEPLSNQLAAGCQKLPAVTASSFAEAAQEEPGFAESDLEQLNPDWPVSICAQGLTTAPSLSGESSQSEERSKLNLKSPGAWQTDITNDNSSELDGAASLPGSNLCLGNFSHALNVNGPGRSAQVAPAPNMAESLAVARSQSNLVGAQQASVVAEQLALAADNKASLNFATLPAEKPVNISPQRQTSFNLTALLAEFQPGKPATEGSFLALEAGDQLVNNAGNKSSLQQQLAATQLSTENAERSLATAAKQLTNHNHQSSLKYSQVVNTSFFASPNTDKIITNNLVLQEAMLPAAELNQLLQAPQVPQTGSQSLAAQPLDDQEPLPSNLGNGMLQNLTILNEQLLTSLKTLSSDFLQDISPMLQQVTTAVNIAAQNHISQISLKIYPENLGIVDVTIEFDVAGAINSIKMLADNPETLKLLVRDYAILERALNDVVKTDDGSLSFGAKDQQNGGNHSYQPPAQRFNHPLPAHSTLEADTKLFQSIKVMGHQSGHLNNIDIRV